MRRAVRQLESRLEVDVPSHHLARLDVAAEIARMKQEQYDLGPDHRGQPAPEEILLVGAVAGHTGCSDSVWCSCVRKLPFQDGGKRLVAANAPAEREGVAEDEDGRPHRVRR